MAAAYMDVKFSYTRYQLTMSLIYLVHFTSNVIEVMMHEARWSAVPARAGGHAIESSDMSIKFRVFS